jgi:hypothetical protein
MVVFPESKFIFLDPFKSNLLTLVHFDRLQSPKTMRSQDFRVTISDLCQENQESEELTKQ